MISMNPAGTMMSGLFERAEGVEHLYRLKLLVPPVLLVLFWVWETLRPYFGWRAARWKHALRNITVALINAIALGGVFGLLTVAVTQWTTANSLGLLSQFPLPRWLTFALALLFLDGWMYVWHRANHAVPLLWWFHRMHHSDDHMDVTTATRFHPGEQAGAATLRLGLIPLVGLDIWHIVTYELLVVAITQFHHADISLGRCDRWLRLMIVTPDMHKVHHSRWRPETDSNYSTVLSIWDRLLRSLRLRSDPHTLDYGLDEFKAPQWQTVWGMLKTPFVSVLRSNERERRGLRRDSNNASPLSK